MDCSRSYGNGECYGKGGHFVKAWNYVKDRGIALYKDYPYVGKDQVCKNIPRGNKISGY